MQKVAFTFIIIGALVMIGYACKDFFTATDIALAIRIAAGAVGLGLILLLASIGRERYVKSKKEEEDFKEVKR